MLAIWKKSLECIMKWKVWHKKVDILVIPQEYGLMWLWLFEQQSISLKQALLLQKESEKRKKLK